LLFYHLFLPSDGILFQRNPQKRVPRESVPIVVKRVIGCKEPFEFLNLTCVGIELVSSFIRIYSTHIQKVVRETFVMQHAALLGQGCTSSSI